MASVGVTVQIDIKEIWTVLCPECKVKIRELLKHKVAEQVADKMLGEQNVP